MVEISDVLVTPQDEEVLSRYDFDFDHIDPVMLDISDLILDDTSGYELQNQIDDAESFKSVGEPYYQRVNFILATCRLLWDEVMLRKAVLEFFAVQNTPLGVKSDGYGNYEQEALEEFIARMTKAVMTNERISKVCDLLFESFMNRPLYSENDKMLRLNRMKIVRGRKLDYAFNHRDEELVIPELKIIKPKCWDEDGKEIDQEAIDEIKKERNLMEEMIDKTTERWMNCEEDEKELQEILTNGFHKFKV